ncbi:hypothetical protein HYX15_01415 [Candidatus Woesearchaeota archaeon]|nr:hypothetical protein [Candidatus Woesearchaeota archaeon]
MKPSIIRRDNAKFYRNKKTLTIILGLFIIGTMVLSMFAYSGSYSSGENYYDYNGYKFIQTENGFLTYIDKNPIEFNFGPQEVEYLQATVDLRSQNFNSLDKVYLSFSPSDNLYSVVKEFVRFIPLNQNYIISCPSDIAGCENLPIKTCEDANDKVGVIQFELSDKTEMITKDTCMTVKGTQLSMIMLIDKIALINLGVMK